MTYYAIGDSNCLYNTFHLPRFIQRTTGSTRMRDIADGTAKIDLCKWGVVSGDRCFFHAGAIDVRCDVHNQIAAGGDESELIAELVGRYLDVLRENEMAGVEFWLVSLLPPPYYLSMPVEVRDHILYPFIGGDELIARYTLRMNVELLAQGNRRGYQYLDIWTRYADARGMLIPALGSKMHVADNKPILAEMHARGLYTDEEAGMEPGLAATITAMQECRA